MTTPDEWDEFEDAPSGVPTWLLPFATVVTFLFWALVVIPPLHPLWSAVRLLISGAAAAGMAHFANKRRPLGRFWWPSVALLALVSGVATLVVGGQIRIARADALAVKYHLAGSMGSVTMKQRCVAARLADWDRMSRAEQMTVPSGTTRRLAPRVCALGIAQGLVRDDGQMSEDSGFALTSQAVDEDPTRSQRCYASLLSLYDRDSSVRRADSRHRRCR
jgi:4-amino-4-deoxy-L-arabinose transferase-like glycosyltransferase